MIRLDWSCAFRIADCSDDPFVSAPAHLHRYRNYDRVVTGGIGSLAWRDLDAHLGAADDNSPDRPERRRVRMLAKRLQNQWFDDPGRDSRDLDVAGTAAAAARETLVVTVAPAARLSRVRWRDAVAGGVEELAAESRCAARRDPSGRVRDQIGSAARSARRACARLLDLRSAALRGVNANCSRAASWRICRGNGYRQESAPIAAIMKKYVLTPCVAAASAAAKLLRGAAQ